MNLRQLCFCATVVLLVILVFPNVLTAEDTPNNQEYQDNDEDDEDTDVSTPPENVDFEPFQNWREDAMIGGLAGFAVGGGVGHHCPPPPVKLASLELCSRAVCTHDANCSRSAADNSTHLICCFNGCIRACVHPLEAPIAFDWIEKPTHMEQSVAPSETAVESMALPGGCIVSSTQYSKLETFKMNQHVSHCFCDIGGIFCKIAES